MRRPRCTAKVTPMSSELVPMLCFAVALAGCGSPQPGSPPAEVVAVPTPVASQPGGEEEEPPPPEPATAASSPPPAPAMGPLGKARVETARMRSLSIGAAVKLWQMSQGGDRCPRHEDLVRDRMLPPDDENRDPWGNPYAIECGDHIVVTSPGPDEQPGTADDVGTPSP